MKTNRLAPGIALLILAFASAARTEQPLRPFQRARLLLYQTYNFPIKGRIGTPGYPDGLRGEAHVTSGGGGRFGEAICFPDGDSAIEYTAEKNFPITIGLNEGTISFWISCDAQAQPEDRFAEWFDVNDGAWNQGAFSIALSFRSPRDLLFSLYASGPVDATGETAGGTPQLLAARDIDWASDEWHAVTASWSGLNTGGPAARMRLYLDGKKVAEQTGFEHIVKWRAGGQVIRLGSGAIGKIDDLAIFGRELSSREVRSLYRNPEGVAGKYLSPPPGED